ncbi:uncharacterized protein LOC123686458 [Harmonia axyridis]|uniref:uncharacterized protein LOC123686458 n=1 Tax=Harmonia axyridis TaxID=115357 RepID=UPI001E27844C|nr:uncharacterized protein LOC123686458 [Harmonia axyridis]XP_045482565.1 uncharacterized protein LOC123686458 [Harmonia axyridis]XP_045482567.1 uncharacterized protein LOC123686458 [Harmonia axyridis]
MPVGTNYRTSTMKNSFSLSSLQGTDVTTPEREIKSRQFNSLTKKRVKSPNVRKSWGSTTSSDQRDDFWMSLQENYNYIMDNNLIDKCQEVKSDIAIERKERERTLDDFIVEYSKLYSLIDSVQEMIYGKEESITDKAIRLQCQSLVLEHSPLMNLLNDRASQLVQSHPEVQDEVTWRLGHLNSKWDTISSILGATECGLCEQDTCLDLDHEIRCLRKWIKTMEQALQPLDLKTKYSKTEIEAKALELKVLHRDIENHGKIVGSVVKLCKKSDASCNRANVRRIANGLERRWHLLFLSSLEWQCYLETLTGLENKNHTYSSDSDSDFSFEPVNKHPRLSSREYLHPNKDPRDKNAVEFDTNEDKATEGVMNTNANILPKAGQQNGFDSVDGKLKHNESADHFTHSNRKGPNLATYYFKHPDTDSDMDKVEKVSMVQESAQETSEDDEWIYNKTEEKELDSTDTNDNMDIPKKISEETIKRLVQKAEELVSPDQTKKLGRLQALNKMSRVKQWLVNKRPEDSCDASGEDEERESQISEDFDESTATYKNNYDNDSHNTSFTELNSTETTPKVMLRQRKYNGNRPWSVSCILQLEPKNGIDEFSHSTSESALHNITPKKIEDFNQTSSSQTVAGNNSTSSTIEDSNTILPEEKTSPNRRRRLKMKRKCSHKYQCSKSDERCLNSRLFKSSSYSGCSNAMNNNSERQTSSDPPSMSLHSFGKYDTTTSGAETDDSFNKRLPSFKVGLKTNYLTSDVRDSSPGKSSLNTAEEQSSSLSEQAWDSYQEKYLSEAYSEAHDSDAARRLLEFGEDYRNFIDSQSDWSTNPDFSPTLRRRTLPLISYNVEPCDTDSDTESLRKFINSSRDQLNYTKEIHQQQVQLGLGQYLESNEISDMLSTCERHIDLLKHIDRSGDCVSRDDKKAATELLDLWIELKQSVMIMQDYRNLQKEILQLKHSLGSIVVPDDGSILDLDDLEKEVVKYEKLLADIQDKKKKLFELNLSVHHFVVEHKEYNASSLKNDISHLYSLWENLHQKTSDRLSQLQPLLETWKTLESRLDQLHGDLRSDEKTLRLLDSALRGGTLSEQTAVYVRDVAKLLSETNVVKGCTIPELFTEGSWSDSGISDEGSEHDVGERERRLAAIRRLVRQLEVVLSPDSDARVHMASRLSSAEEELKELQKQCRSLIVRSAVCPLPNVAGHSEDKHAGEVNSAKGKDGGGDPDDDDAGKASWFKRAVRASVPFQLVLVTILCIAWLLEPQCCDNMNNYAWSLSPKLRYINGPPPI